MLFSIVMPLYNAETYLKETINSVLAQTLVDFELICLDDCSTDDTCKIIKNFAQQDKRISIICGKVHKGAAYNRNKGIEIAKGDYITFWDGDDIYMPNLLEKCYEQIRNDRTDIIYYSSVFCTSDTIYDKIRTDNRYNHLRDNYYGSLNIGAFNIYDYLSIIIGPSVKVYRRDFIIEKKIWFQEIQCCNDVYFGILSMVLAESISILQVDEALLHIREHNSPSRISSNRNPMCSYYATKEVIERIGQEENSKEIKDKVLTNCLMMILREIANAESDIAARCYNFMKKEGISYLKSIEKDFEKQPEYVLKYWNMFSLPYESKWFSNIFLISLILDKYSSQIVKKIKSLTKNKILIIWGYGKQGRIIVDFLKSNGLSIEAVIDKNYKNIVEDGINVASPDGVKEIENAVIIPTSNYVWRDINKEMHSETVDFLDLEDISNWK